MVLAHRNLRRGAVVVWTAAMMPMLLGFVALSVDAGYIYMVRTELQVAADAAALAGAWTLYDEFGEGDEFAARAEAERFAALNLRPSSTSSGGLGDDGFVLGWIPDPNDPKSPFTPTFVDQANTVRVLVRRTSAFGNPVQTFFASIFGVHHVDVTATASVSMMGVQQADSVPLALRAPGFGPVDPEIVEANPGKDGPSEPADGVAFEIGEQVTLFTFGKGKKSPVHLILNTTDISGEAHLGKVFLGEEPPVPLALGDEIDVLGEGTGHNGLGGKLAERLDDADPDNDIILVPIVEPLPDSRNAEGELDGKVVVVSFLVVRLDGIVEETVPDPNDPQDNGKTIDIELLVGTVVQRAVVGKPGEGPPVYVAGLSAMVPVLTR